MVFDSILVSTGRPTNSSTKTEIINLGQEGVTCKDLEEYPWQIYGALGFNMGSLPVICGGRDESGPIVNQCHRLESGKWQPFATLTQGYVYYHQILISKQLRFHSVRPNVYTILALL